MEPVADNVLRQVDPRWIRVERIGSWLFTAGVSAAALTGVIVAFFAGADGAGALVPMLLGWTAVTGGLGWLSERYPRWQFDRTWYRTGPLGIEIRKGVWWRKVINVPRSRIQHTDVAQGPLLRRFGLATLV
ncbi:MAG: PH domain-containing protein, partial [Planctomycetota bacterium]